MNIEFKYYGWRAVEGQCENGITIEEVKLKLGLKRWKGGIYQMRIRIQALSTPQDLCETQLWASTEENYVKQDAAHRGKELLPLLLELTLLLMSNQRKGTGNLVISCSHEYSNSIKKLITNAKDVHLW